MDFPLKDKNNIILPHPMNPSLFDAKSQSVSDVRLLHVYGRREEGGVDGPITTLSGESTARVPGASASQRSSSVELVASEVNLISSSAIARGWST